MSSRCKKCTCIHVYVIIRSHSLHAVQMMRPIATNVARSVVCVSVCVLFTRMCAAKMTEPIKMPFGGGADSRGSKEPCIRWSQDRTNLFAAVRGDISAMRPFIKILRPLVLIIIRSA